MKKNKIIYTKSVAILIAAFIALPSIIYSQNFVDGVVDSVIVTPVNLTSFTGKKIEKNVQLIWTTATEKNNSHYIIQRSNDGVNFENIAKVFGKGNSSSINNYDYSDLNVPNKNLHYRLQQVDEDGKSTLSSIIFIKYDKKENIEINIYPNPIINYEGFITIKNAPIGQYNIYLNGLKGETVFVKNINQAIVNTNVKIQLPTSISKGYYILIIKSINGEINLTEKVIIE